MIKKNPRKFSFSLFFVMAIALIFGTNAQANLFQGETVQLSYYAPTTSDLFRGPWTATVGPGIEFTYVLGCFSGASCIDVDISDTNILVSMHYGTEPGDFTPYSFNGIRIYDLNGKIPAFTSGTINPATTLPGFGASRVAYDDNNIWLNFEGLYGTGYPIVSIDVGSTSALPEPTTLFFLGMGLIGIAGLKRIK
jgi:hypothetical protein